MHCVGSVEVSIEPTKGRTANESTRGTQAERQHESSRYRQHESSGSGSLIARECLSPMLVASFMVDVLGRFVVAGLACYTCFSLPQTVELMHRVQWWAWVDHMLAIGGMHARRDIKERPLSPYVWLALALAQLFLVLPATAQLFRVIRFICKYRNQIDYDGKIAHV